MLHAQRLSFGFPQKELFNNISFSLEKGRHCALIGSNGAGKTTLIRLLRRPEDFLYDGKLSLEGIGRMGYVSQFAQRDKEEDTTVLDYLSQDFLRLEAETAEVCAQMEDAEDLEALLERYQELLDEADSMDAEHYEVNIRRELHLAELEDKAELRLADLSGGEYKLVQVIRQMLRRPGLLIMDEPDVFLDFENLTGLRELINNYSGTLLVVTHSRYLLAHCFDQIWHLENGDLQEYDGSFPAYQHARLQEKIDLRLAAIKDEAEIERITALVERLRDDATEVIDPQKGRTLKGKVSYLERLQQRKVKAPFVDIQEPRITFPEVEEGGNEELLRVEDYRLAYEETLLDHVSFSVRAGEKVALVGPNGTGKTSMLRDIQRGKGSAIRFSEQARVGYFSQLHEEVLEEDSSIYEAFYALGFPTAQSVEEHLKDYCFDPDSLHRKISQLSGGEKNLLQLARLSAGDYNFLLLDEPSSHLDTFAQQALETALRAYRGAVLMVSHDFYHIAACADQILYVENGALRPMSPRAFRKMIYKHHFHKDYLELEQQRVDLETRTARALEAGDCAQAQVLCERLGTIVEQMKH